MNSPDRHAAPFAQALREEAENTPLTGGGLERIRARIAAPRPPWRRRLIDCMRKAGTRGAIPGTGPHDTHPRTPHKH